MMRVVRCVCILVMWGLAVGCIGTAACAAPLAIRIESPRRIVAVGVIARWNDDGSPRRAPDPRARIDRPPFDATARPADGDLWVFDQLQAGRYDVVILAEDRVRIEGFEFPPLEEFDEFWTVGKQPADAAVERVRELIAQSRHFENRVTPLFFAGDRNRIRVLVQLIRDERTSFDAQYGQPVGTIRHEIWQFRWQYGDWAKDRRTRVLDRVLMPRRELHQWTWLWDPRLGGLQVGQQPVELRYAIPERLDGMPARGLLPLATSTGENR